MEGRFNNIVDIVNTGKIKYDKNIIDSYDKLYMYKYYKQAIIGDCNIDKPDIMDYQKYIKWLAWNSIRGTSRENAMLQYIETYHKLLSKYCLSMYFSKHNYI